MVMFRMEIKNADGDKKNTNTYKSFCFEELYEMIVKHRIRKDYKYCSSN